MVSSRKGKSQGEGEIAVRMDAISKRFGEIVANDGINLTVYRGEVHALVGENGAGKTTLMNILYGLVKPDAGTITVDDMRLPVERGFLGTDYGLGMIHQHFMLVKRFTVLENIILGFEPSRGGFLDLRAAVRKVEDIMQRYGIEVPLDRRVEELSVGEEQRVEILKALYRNSRIIIMDEPTAVLTPQEIKKLFETIRMLVDSSHTIIFITHKLEEVMEIADRVTVLRRGRVVRTRRIDEVDPEELAIMMVGKKIEAPRRSKHAVSMESLLSLHDVSLRSSRDIVLLSSIDFEVRKGEIFGICGVEGNGQDELFDVAIGLQKPSSGRILFRGKDITHLSTAKRRALGIAYIPPDRVTMGIVAGMSVKENMLLGRQREPGLSGTFFLKEDAITNLTQRLLKTFGINPPLPDAEIGTLSGGNQQKVIVARELSREPSLLIASQPARGLDIMATRLIHDSLVKHAEAGGGVLLISADLSEIVELSDRIGVMYKGRILSILERKEADEEKLGLLMLGFAQ